MIPSVRGANLPRDRQANSFIPGAFDFESDVDAYTVYADVAGSQPTFGANGAANITIAYNTASPLSGYASLDIVKPSGNFQGESIASNFRIGLGDRGSVLRLSFKYRIFSGTFEAGTASADSNLTAYIYDVTNARLIPLSDRKLYSDSSVSATFSGLFQTSVDSVDYRLVLFVGTTYSNAWSMKIDDLVITSAQTLQACIVTDWQPFPSVAAGTLITGETVNPTYGTVAQNVAYWRRVGDSMEIMWDYRQTTAGTTGTGMTLFNLPAGYAADTTKLAVNTGSGTPTSQVGSFTLRNPTGPAEWGPGAVYLYSATQLRAHFGYTAGSGVADADLIWGSNSGIGFGTRAAMGFSIRATIPIAGWGSAISSVMTGDDGRAIVASYKGMAGATSSTTQPIQWNTIVGDTHSAVTTGSNWKFTAPIASWYDFTGLMSQSTTDTYIRLYVNGTFAERLALSITGHFNRFAGKVYLKAGDYFDIRTSDSVSINADTDSMISISRIGGNAVALGFIETASSYLRYTSGLARGATNTNVVRYSSPQETSGESILYAADANLGDSFTINASGEYAISANVHSTDANVTAELCVGPSISNSFDTTNTRCAGYQTTGGGGIPMSWEGRITAGSKIWVLFNGDTSGSANKNQITIVRRK